MTPVELLAGARRLVNEPNALTVGLWARAAALLARQALEKSIRQSLYQEYKVTGRPTFRSQLICLRALVDEELAEEAAWTWTALSSATHVQGYGMPPTAGELTRWIASVERVVLRLG